MSQPRRQEPQEPFTGVHSGEWMTLNLPWRMAFWERIRPLTLMRLNPHWNVEPRAQGGQKAAETTTWDVQDVLLERHFPASPELSAGPGRWVARFPGIGLVLEAESRDNGANTALRWEQDPAAEPGQGLPLAALRRTVQYWLPSLREYYRLFESDGIKHRFWRLFMDKVMLTMNPAQRRICSFIFKFTLVELVLILVLLVAYFQFIAA